MMKRIFTILILLCALQLTACAQWYLFPGKKKKAETAEKKEIPVEVSPVTEAPDSSVTGLVEAGQDAECDLWYYDAPSEISVSLILPLKSASESPSANFTEMYSGALLALRDLGRDGTRVNLRVIDSTSEELDESTLSGSDVVIGPVGYKEIVSALPLCGRRMLISPLEPRTVSLAEQGDNVIQSPVPWARQIDEMLDWLQEDLRLGDEVIVLRESSLTEPGEQSAYMLSGLQERGIIYKPMQSLDELNGEDGFRTLGMQRKYRILIASDSDSFISSSVRSTGIAAELHGDLVLYSTSKVRNCVGPDVLDLYNAETRMTAAYYVDYDSQAVKDFVLSYRALYGGEPGSFAFQGYDTVHYFVRMCREYGRLWHMRLPDSRERGLQSDFRFESGIGNGRVNQAVRRVIYGKDLSVSLL